MNERKYKQIRTAVAAFVAATVSISVTIENYILAVAGVLIGMLFLSVIRSKTKISVDERERTMREKAAIMTYSIITPTIGLGSFLLFAISGRGNVYLQSLAIVFSYLTLFIMAVYALSYYFYSRRYGGGGNEE